MIPEDATIVGLVLSIRDNAVPAGDIVTATIFTSPCGFDTPVNTGISASITGPNIEDDPNCLATASGSVPVTQGSLLSVQFTNTGGGSLDQGAAVTIFLTIP